MKICIRTSVAIPTLWLLLSSTGHAAESPVPASPGRHGAVAGEHARHTDGAGAEVAAKEYGAAKRTSWTAFPTLKMKTSEGRVTTVVPQGIVANSIDAYSNDIKDAKGHRQLPLEMSGARLDKPENGGFHWLAAREEQADSVRVASTVYFFSGSGKNPTAMFMQQKHELEIIPQPFPREHSRYRANEDWKFLVRFNGKPLANQKVNLETQNGTNTELLSDAQGMITAHLPDDFKTEAGQKVTGKFSQERRTSDFILATGHAEGGKTYLTGFNSSYGTDAFDQRSLAMGLGFMLLGMVGAAPLLRQRKDAKAADAKPAADDAAKKGDA